MDSPLCRLTHDDYTIAIMCPMGLELAPVRAMLEELHEDLPTNRDMNSYTFGRMGKHNVVVAVMPEIGNNNAAAVAIQLLNDFRCIRFSLLVGIGGGIPGGDEDDIRLGDVVVSKPTATFGGVVQFDRGKIHKNGRFERTGNLKKPPAVLMAYVQKLGAEHKVLGNNILENVSQMLEKYPMMKEEYDFQGIDRDLLFEADYHHEGGASCQRCDPNRVVERAVRKNVTPRIHYGTIGSANEVIRDSRTRDKLRKDLGILCVEMEAAGLMDEFSCLVIRGICDYADSHKNKRWQPYAAAVAAAYAKELLSIIPVQEIFGTSKAVNTFQMASDGGTMLLLRDKLLIQKGLGQENLQELLEKLSDYDHENAHRRLSRKRAKGTGTWLLEHPVFKEWLNAKGPASLWCSGIIGSGKTKLATAVVDVAKENSRKFGHAVMYFYCESSQRDKLGGSDLLASFIKQLLVYLASICKPWPEAVQKDIRKYFGRKSSEPDFDDLADIFSSVYACAPKAIYVVDGLDEFEGVGVMKVLDTFRKLLANKSEKPGSRFLIFSRDQVAPNLSVARMVPGIAHISTALANIMPDMQQYVEESIDEKMHTRELTRDHTLMEEIKRRLLAEASEMFLWVYLQVETLWDTCITDADIRHALANLPKDLEETYRRCLERICSRPNLYALKVLKWVAYAARPLRIEELEEAVAFNLQDRQWDSEKIPSSAAIISHCANLVVLDAVDGYVRFAHHSVKQFLEDNPTYADIAGNFEHRIFPIDPSQGELECGELCVAYLSFADFGFQIEKHSDTKLPIKAPDVMGTLALGSFGTMASKVAKFITPSPDKQRKAVHLQVPRKPPKAPRIDRGKYSLLDYAVANWATQTKMITITSPVWERFQLLAMNPNEYWNIHPWISGGRSYSSHLHGLLGWAVRKRHIPLLKLCVDLEPRYGLRHICNLPLIGGSLPALHVASRLGYDDVVKSLLQCCSVNQKDEQGYTAGHHAVEKGHLEVVKLLLDENDLFFDMTSNFGDTLIVLAVTNGHEKILSFLIEKDVGLFISVKFHRHKSGRTLISRAAEMGHEEVVKLLLRQNVSDVVTKDTSGETPIMCAARVGNEAIVKLLLEWNAEIECRDVFGRTPLFMAVENAHSSVIAILLREGADLESRDSNKQSPLSIAVRKGNEAIVQLLLQNGADIETTDIKRRTPLSWAAGRGHIAVTKLLIDEGAKLERSDIDGQSALSWAAINGHEEIVKLLLEKGAFLEPADKFSNTPLLLAATKGHKAIVKLLLEKGADLMSRSSSSKPPLPWAAEMQNEADMKLSRGEDVDLDFRNSLGRARAWTRLF